MTLLVGNKEGIQPVESHLAIPNSFLRQIHGKPDMSHVDNRKIGKLNKSKSSCDAILLKLVVGILRYGTESAEMLYISNKWNVIEC